MISARGSCPVPPRHTHTPAGAHSPPLHHLLQLLELLVLLQHLQLIEALQLFRCHLRQGMHLLLLLFLPLPQALLKGSSPALGLFPGQSSALGVPPLSSPQSSAPERPQGPRLIHPLLGTTGARCLVGPSLRFAPYGVFLARTGRDRYSGTWHHTPHAISILWSWERNTGALYYGSSHIFLCLVF